MKAYLGLGGNIGDVIKNLNAAIVRLCTEYNCTLVNCSSFYETPPWGLTSQPNFINSCCLIDTNLTPDDLLLACQQIESVFKRQRDRRWGPRTIDIDILMVDCVSYFKSSTLTLPHPHLTERAFALVPLNEIAPELIVSNKTVQKWCCEVDQQGIRKIASSLL